MCIDKILLNEVIVVDNALEYICVTIDLLERAKLHFTCNIGSVGLSVDVFSSREDILYHSFCEV